MTEQRFIDNGDGTVTDTWTKLMWMQEDSFLMIKKFLVYLHAQRLRDKLNSESFAGHTDWRFPTKREAHSLFDKLNSVKDKYGYDIHIDPVFYARLRLRHLDFSCSRNDDCLLLFL